MEIRTQAVGWFENAKSDKASPMPSIHATSSPLTLWFFQFKVFLTQIGCLLSYLFNFKPWSSNHIQSPPKRVVCVSWMVYFYDKYRYLESKWRGKGLLLEGSNPKIEDKRVPGVNILLPMFFLGFCATKTSLFHQVSRFTDLRVEGFRDLRQVLCCCHVRGGFSAVGTFRPRWGMKSPDGPKVWISCFGMVHL